jgi:hypothetical protein
MFNTRQRSDPPNVVGDEMSAIGSKFFVTISEIVLANKSLATLEPTFRRSREAILLLLAVGSSSDYAWLISLFFRRLI